jgi:sialate O-acetylesterase
MMYKRILTLAALASLTWSVQAKVKLSHLVGDNMVIQQQTDVRLWGWAKPNSTVTATTSWSQERSTAKVGKDGQFLLTVKSPKASYTPLSITFNDGDGEVTINNVLAGEVWVCAGQSNM